MGNVHVCVDDPLLTTELYTLTAKAVITNTYTQRHAAFHTPK